MTFLSPADICRLGATSHYWRAMIRDQLLWRYFLLRDMPSWPSIDHVTMPQLDAPLINEDESLDDREDGCDKGTELKLDYMTEWVSLFLILYEDQLVTFFEDRNFGLPQQIPERLPVLQTAVASLTASVRGRDLILSVSGALLRATLCHAWPWHGAVGCLFSHKAHACP